MRTHTDIPGFERRDLPTGARYLKIQHFADPAKNADWLEEVRAEMADTPDEFELEIKMNEDVWTEGRPVYRTFVKEFHAPPRFAEERIPVIGNSRWAMGWDGGTASVQPAAVLLQLSPKTPKMAPMVWAMMEITSDPGTGLETFVPMALDAVREIYPEVPLRNVKHACDETARNRSGIDLRTGEDVFRENGISLHLVSNKFGQRRAAVDKLLAGTWDYGGRQSPVFVVGRMHCPLLYKGFCGGYRLKKIAMAGNAIRYNPEPEKDEYSHPHDGLQYAAVLAGLMLGPGARTGSKAR